MSRVGNSIINIPSGIELKIDSDNLVTIKGAKGSLSQQVDKEFTVKLEDGVLTVQRPSEQKRHKALHGLYRALLNNMVVGVSSGYVKELELYGVGYRASNKGQLLELALGYSHPIYFAVPDEVKLTTEMAKGKAPNIKLESHDKQLIGQVAAKIRAFRSPEPYKGKGIRFKGEQIRRKEGKSAGK